MNTLFFVHIIYIFMFEQLITQQFDSFPWGLL
jgi:hypothetical protein